MLTITLPKVDYFDEAKEEFVTVDSATIRLEHSLVSLSKWESEFEKPFLTTDDKTDKEVLSYISCMSIDEDLSPEFISRLSRSDLDRINKYIGAKRSATWFSDPDPKQGASKSTALTSELIYYWLVALSIPFECESWHLSRLFNLIKICNQKNSPPKKMSAGDLAARHRQMNAERKAKHKTSG